VLLLLTLLLLPLLLEVLEAALASSGERWK
jgi:hypothetical protein